MISTLERLASTLESVRNEVFYLRYSDYDTTDHYATSDREWLLSEMIKDIDFIIEDMKIMITTKSEEIK